MSEIHSFITLEGGEGVGKTTALSFIQQYFSEKNAPYVLTREPGGTPIAEKIRDILLQPHEEPLEKEAELLLMFAARCQHVATVIKPALQNNKWVICDRFVDATYAYQGAGRGIDKHFIETIETLTLRGFKPGLTLLLDAPVELCLERMRARGKAFDRIERESLAFFERVRQCYLQRAKAEPTRFKIINTACDLAATAAQIRQVLEQYSY